MASEFRRLLDTQTLSSAKWLERDLVFDAGAYTQLNAVFYVLKLGTDSTNALTIKLQHAAVNEEDAFSDLKDIDGIAVSVNIEDTGGVVGNTFFHITQFTCYIRWVVTAGGTVSAAAIVGCDLVAKE